MKHKYSGANIKIVKHYDIEQQKLELNTLRKDLDFLRKIINSILANLGYSKMEMEKQVSLLEKIDVSPEIIDTVKKCWELREIIGEECLVRINKLFDTYKNYKMMEKEYYEKFAEYNKP